MGAAPQTYDFNGYNLTADSKSNAVAGNWKYRGQMLSGEQSTWLDQILAIDKAVNPKAPDPGEEILREQAGMQVRRRAADTAGLGSFFGMNLAPPKGYK